VSSTGAGESVWRSLVLAVGGALLLVPAVWLFLPVLDYPFLNLDDDYFVVTNPAIRDLSWDGIRHLFVSDDRDFRYFPVVYLSFAVDYHFFGLDAAAFHRTNVILHLFNTLLVAAVASRLAASWPVAAGTALLFSVHPLQIESVVWVMGRKTVLFFFFFLLSTLVYTGSRRARDRGGAWGAAAHGVGLALFVLAVLSKTTAVTLPAVLLLVDWLREPRALGAAAFLRRHLPSKLPYLVVVVAAWVVTHGAAARSPFSTDAELGAFEWLVVAGHNLFFYVYKALVPTGLGIFYPVPTGTLPIVFYVFAIATVVLVGVIAVTVRRRQVLFGLGWYVVTILPMALLPVLMSDLPILAADRYCYQSSVGLFFGFCCALAACWDRPPAPAGVARAAIGCACAVLVVALGLRAAEHRDTWRTTTAVYEQLLRHHPSDEFYYRLAFEYDDAGATARARDALDAADAAPNRIFFSRLFYFQLRLSELYRRKGDLSRAAQYLDAAIASTPNAIEPDRADCPPALLYLAELYEQAGDPERAALARQRAAASRVVASEYVRMRFVRHAPDAARRYF